VQAQGGSIECQSELGIGSTFSVILPVVSDAKIDTFGVAKQKLIIG